MTATKYLKIYVCLFLFFVPACAMLDPDIPEYDTSSKELLPEMEIVGAEQIYTWQATLKIRIKNREGVRPHKLVLCYSPDYNLPDTTMKSINMQSEYTGGDTIKVHLTNLQAATCYYCRIYVETRDEKGYSDTFQFTTTQQKNDQVWTKVGKLPDESDTYSWCRAVVIGRDVYIRGAMIEGSYDTGRFTIWKYTPSSNVWAKISDFPGGNRTDIVMFNIDSKLYVGMGTIPESQGNRHQSDFWEYDTQKDTWKEVAGYPVFDTSVAASFGCKGKGFVLSNSGTLFMYDPSSDSWTERNNFPDTPVGASLVAVGQDRVFIVGGAFLLTSDPPFSKMLWEYKAENDTWLRHADFPGTGRWWPMGFLIGDNLYFGYGEESTGGNYMDIVNDWWCYSIGTNRWESRSVIPAPYSGMFLLCFGMDNAGYLGTNTEFWKYLPELDE